MYELHKYWEHCDETAGNWASTCIDKKIFFPKRRFDDGVCIQFCQSEAVIKIKSSYFIGLDWLDENNAVYIAPKFNQGARQTDYLTMLFSCLQHPEVLEHCEELYEIKFDQQEIEIEQTEDLLTPLLVIQFLQVLHSIVKKGLKKSYYFVDTSLNSRVKGRILVGETIKRHHAKNQPVRTRCRYQEFGWNGVENRLLKRALLFVRRYIAAYPRSIVDVSSLMNYCLPAFEQIDNRVALSEIKAIKSNAFYKEYALGIRLAKLILRRFGYNLQTVSKNEKVKTPPFWIDMSRLFELYVLGLLKDQYGKAIYYHFTTNKNELDYLLNTYEYQMVIDAKYKAIYRTSYNNDDIRQLSGYARLKRVVDKLEIPPEKVIDCLIIYPDQGPEIQNKLTAELKTKSIPQFVQFYKMPIRLPEIPN